VKTNEKTSERKGRASAAGGAADGAEPKRGKGSAGQGVELDESACAETAADAEATPETGEAAGASATADEPQEDADARYMRLAADFQNFKKRTEKEKADIYAYANSKFATDLLEVIDNFERAIAQDAVQGADGKFIEGMAMIKDQLVNTLERNDVEEIPALGEDFDPNVHNAVQMMESKDYESGKVTDVVQKGYKMKDKVLRPATVVVAK
jgi:molecular chaperone GrpE